MFFSCVHCVVLCAGWCAVWRVVWCGVVLCCVHDVCVLCVCSSLKEVSRDTHFLKNTDVFNLDIKCLFFLKVFPLLQSWHTCIPLFLPFTPRKSAKAPSRRKLRASNMLMLPPFLGPLCVNSAPHRARITHANMFSRRAQGNSRSHCQRMSCRTPGLIAHLFFCRTAVLLYSTLQTGLTLCFADPCSKPQQLHHSEWDAPMWDAVRRRAGRSSSSFQKPGSRTPESLKSRPWPVCNGNVVAVTRGVVLATVGGPPGRMRRLFCNWHLCPFPRCVFYRVVHTTPRVSRCHLRPLEMWHPREWSWKRLGPRRWHPRDRRGFRVRYPR